MPTISHASVERIMASCRAHGSCDESRYQEGKRLAARIVDGLIAFALGNAIHHIEVSWQPGVDMLSYIAYDSNDASLAAIVVRDAAVPCGTAALAGFVLYCQEERGIRCDLLPEPAFVVTVGVSGEVG